LHVAKLIVILIPDGGQQGSEQSTTACSPSPPKNTVRPKKAMLSTPTKTMDESYLQFKSRQLATSKNKQQSTVLTVRGRVDRELRNSGMIFWWTIRW
jgi:hypothetical protein